MSGFDLGGWTKSRRALLEPRLLDTFPDAFPPRLQEACRYPIHTGGKRMRPLLCFAAAECVGGQAEAVLAPAMAVELLHTYSLVHDDLPCMDDDDERRGRPTVHKVYGDAMAVLVGDALLTESFAVLAEHPRLVAELARAGGASGMIAGQVLDISGGITTLDALHQLHRAKTGALIRCAVRMGAIASGATDAQLAALTTFGEAVGLAFQVHDDLLDADQDAGADGPPSFVRFFGKDGTAARAAALIDEAAAAVAHLPHPEALLALARYTVERTV